MSEASPTQGPDMWYSTFYQNKVLIYQALVPSPFPSKSHTSHFCTKLWSKTLVEVSIYISTTWCYFWWTRESPRAHVANFYCRLRLIRSVLRASTFSVLKLTEIVILWVYYIIPFGFRSFRHFWASYFNFLHYFVWLRITDEGSVPKMRVWSILLVKSDIKWCIHLSRSLYVYYILPSIPHSWSPYRSTPSWGR